MTRRTYIVAAIIMMAANSAVAEERLHLKLAQHLGWEVGAGTPAENNGAWSLSLTTGGIAILYVGHLLLEVLLADTYARIRQQPASRRARKRDVSQDLEDTGSIDTSHKRGKSDD